MIEEILGLEHLPRLKICFTNTALLIGVGVKIDFPGAVYFFQGYIEFAIVGFGLAATVPGELVDAQLIGPIAFNNAVDKTEFNFLFEALPVPAIKVFEVAVFVLLPNVNGISIYWKGYSEPD